ncbi:hypothetical protein R0137_00820 [Congregibacter brevis]|uniref:DUF4153 domain-containing protein n=1 Tax=Congregibacter brevis TaxID=3081201 RepID=A0ABZ0IDE6_9GAMM|nr:hypothetical protein R0137_00820 [Congregibacter sp. IMCC45268]
MTLAKYTRSAFFSRYAMALLAVVLIGFAPSFFLRLVIESEPLPFYLHLHGALLTGWFAIVCGQALLIRKDDVMLHRRLGRFFAVYGAAVAIAALMATFNWVERELAMGATFESDMAAVNPLQASGVSFQDFAAALVCFNLASVLGFVVLLALAVVFRREGSHHKRYVLFASLSIVTPGVARISRIVMQTEMGPIIPLGIAGLGLAILIADFQSLGRLHPASLRASLILFIVNGVAGFVALSPYGARLVRALA